MNRKNYSPLEWEISTTRRTDLPRYATITPYELTLISQEQRDELIKQSLDDHKRYCDSLTDPEKYDPEHERYMEALTEFERQNPYRNL